MGKVIKFNPNNKYDYVRQNVVRTFKALDPEKKDIIDEVQEATDTRIQQILDRYEEKIQEFEEKYSSAEQEFDMCMSNIISKYRHPALILILMDYLKDAAISFVRERGDTVPETEEEVWAAVEHYVNSLETSIIHHCIMDATEEVFEVEENY